MTATQPGHQGAASQGLGAHKDDWEKFRVSRACDGNASGAMGMGDWDERSPYMQSTFAAGCDGQTSKKTRTEEPRGEDVPGASGEDPLEQPTYALDRGSEKEREECGGGPRPGPLEEDDVEGAAFGR